MRLHFNLRVAPGSEAVFDHDALEQQIIELASDWPSELNDVLVATFGELRGRALSRQIPPRAARPDPRRRHPHRLGPD